MTAAEVSIIAAVVSAIAAAISAWQAVRANRLLSQSGREDLKRRVEQLLMSWELLFVDPMAAAGDLDNSSWRSDETWGRRFRSFEAALSRLEKASGSSDFLGPCKRIRDVLCDPETTDRSRIVDCYFKVKRSGAIEDLGVALLKFESR